MFRLLAVIFFAVGFPLYSYASGCEYDTQCKNDRICENGKCVSPGSSSNADSHAKKDLSTTILSVTPPENPPYFCCSAAGKAGPYPNPDSDGKMLHTGDACRGVTPSARMIIGTVCN